MRTLNLYLKKLHIPPGSTVNAAVCAMSPELSWRVIPRLVPGEIHYVRYR
jgi:hypothetical protein